MTFRQSTMTIGHLNRSPSWVRRFYPYFPISSYIVPYIFVWKPLNGNSRILKWRYVSTICLAIFCWDIHLLGSWNSHWTSIYSGDLGDFPASGAGKILQVPEQRPSSPELLQLPEMHRLAKRVKDELVPWWKPWDFDGFHRDFCKKRVLNGNSSNSEWWFLVV